MRWTLITLGGFVLAVLVTLEIIRLVGWVLEAPRRKFFRGRWKR